jgi:hypothetical protein
MAPGIVLLFMQILDDSCQTLAGCTVHYDSPMRPGCHLEDKVLSGYCDVLMTDLDGL